jgi:hypothetical protein
MFGLVEEGADTLRVSQRARTILAPVMPADAERAKVDAFLSVDFFAKFYERFKGTTLPQEAGLKNLLENTYAVVPGRVVASLRVLMDSADQAGFFKASGNRSRMVMPLITKGSADGNITEVETHDPPPGNQGNADEGQNRLKNRWSGGHGGGGGAGADHDIPSALLGLLEKLPPVGTPIPPKRRAALTDAFKSTINFLYPEVEDGESV